MPHDILHIECPSCPEEIEFWTYTGPNMEIDFALEDAPNTVIEEALRESKNERIQCPYCQTYVTLHVKMLVYATPMQTSDRIKLVWRDET